MVAAVLDGDEGARAVLRGGRYVGRGVPRARIKLLCIGDETVDFGHRGQLVALDIARAAGHQQARIGIGAAGAADRLARLAHRFAGYCAAVDHDEIVLACQHRADLFAFGQVEPATQRDDLRAAHAKSPHSKLPR